MSVDAQPAPRLPLPRANVLGVGVHALDLERALGEIASAVRARRKGYVCVTGVHGVMEARRDPELRRILNGALLNVPDGMPTVWVGRLQGHRRMRRVFGPELMEALCRLSQDVGFTHFLYGGAPGVAEALRARLLARFPRLRIAGTFTPPFRPLRREEEQRLAAEVARVRPDLFWVGLSTPKQERFMQALLPRLDTAVMLGVGAAFDYHTGRIRDAPRWVKQSGLQWAHRLAQDPRRLWRRYATHNPRFLASISLQLLGLQAHPLDEHSSRTAHARASAADDLAR
jgi:N-acetylglucosaminyldiphosphoundecaprenol N-acetyl-beta-D-mannosaminyltransferase